MLKWFYGFGLSSSCSNFHLSPTQIEFKLLKKKKLNSNLIQILKIIIQTYSKIRLS